MMPEMRQRPSLFQASPPQSLYTFFLGVKVTQPGGGVLLGDGVAKNVSL